MKRRLILVLLLLVAGAIVNVAVAWGCVAFSPLHESGNGILNEAWIDRWKHEIASAQRTPSFRFEGLPSRSRNGFGVAQTVGTCIAEMGRGGIDRQYVAVGGFGEVKGGWPMLALQGSAMANRMSFGRVAVWQREHSIPRPWPTNSTNWQGDDWRDLPCDPLVRGFAINTLFYAAILWTLFAAPFAIRRRRRIKHGLCPKCGYPVGMGGTSDVCTECGTPRAVVRLPLPSGEGRGEGGVREE